MKKGSKLLTADWFACILWAFCLLVLPLPWLAAAFTAAFAHELGHIAMLYAVGNRMLELRIGVFGAVIATQPLTPKKELLCAAAGPAASLALLLLWPQMPRLAFCGGVQGIYNLIPVYPMDGGRIMRCLWKISFPEKETDTAQSILEYSSLFLLGVAACAAAFVLRVGILPLAFFLFLLHSRAKIPCKRRQQIVQ